MKVSDVLFYAFVGLTATGLFIGALNALEIEGQGYNERMAKWQVEMSDEGRHRN